MRRAAPNDLVGLLDHVGDAAEALPDVQRTDVAASSGWPSGRMGSFRTETSLKTTVADRRGSIVGPGVGRLDQMVVDGDDPLGRHRTASRVHG
jgi:hypothetical protein